MSSKEKNYSFNPLLFTNDIGYSLTFVIKPCKDKETLRDMIEFGGGEVVSTPGDHGITLIPPAVDVTTSDEVYSTEYIKDCCSRNILQDLKQYRLNATSKFPDNFDVMRVVLKFTSWSEALKGPPAEKELFSAYSSPSSSKSCSDDPDECEVLCACTGSSEIDPQFQKTERHIQIEPRDLKMDSEMSEDIPEVEKVRDTDDGLIKVSEDESEESGDDDDDNTRSPKQQQSNLRRRETISSTRVQTEKASSYSSSPEGEVVSEEDDELWNLHNKRPKRGLKFRRRDYSSKERMAILKFITKYRCHNYVKGREIWQKAEAAQICQGRTWQSMKEHFIKKIIPNIKLYDLSEEEIRKFQKPFH